jgi:hypothetical protein
VIAATVLRARDSQKWGKKPRVGSVPLYHRTIRARQGDSSTSRRKRRAGIETGTVATGILGGEVAITNGWSRYRGEGRGPISRKVFHGQRGELRQRYREGQEDQLGALGLVVIAICFRLPLGLEFVWIHSD